MKTLTQFQLPKEYRYYRSSSKVFQRYYTSVGYTLILLGNTGEYARAEKKIWGLYWKVEVIKCEHEITSEILKSHGIKRALVFWTPIRKNKKPQGWYTLPSFFPMINLHSSHSAFSELREEYKKTWSSAGRNHANQIAKKISSGEIQIIEETSLGVFIDFLGHPKNHDPQKRSVIRMTQKLFLGAGEKNYRIYSLFQAQKKIASALFLDDGTLSEYWAACYLPESKKYHAGIALIDIWMHDSFHRGIKICDFDHMRDTGQSRSFAGYTQFKSGLAQYSVKFRDTWIRFFY